MILAVFIRRYDNLETLSNVGLLKISGKKTILSTFMLFGRICFDGAGPLNGHHTAVAENG